MIRTQLYITKQLYRDINLIAKKEKKPAAQVIRELLTDSIGQKKQQTSIGKALLKLTEVKGKGPADLSVNIDKYLYEQ